LHPPPGQPRILNTEVKDAGRGQKLNRAGGIKHDLAFRLKDAPDAGGHGAIRIDGNDVVNLGFTVLWLEDAPYGSHSWLHAVRADD
jgi:hypothetical protein